jgi:stage II sporulation protein D
MVLGVPGKIERRFQGRLEVTPREGGLQVVVAMDREVAVASSVAAESPPRAPLEALKAQAVVTRSYYAAAGPRHDEFDFCDTTHCQYLREPPALDHTAGRATRATRKLVLRYQGQTVGALFSASCGGRTRSLAEVGMGSAGYPYFSVECPYCRRGAPRWEARLEAKDIARLLEADRSEQARLDVGRRLGWNTVPGNNYRVHREEGTLVLEGRGRGHGIGLCQEGAAAMAAVGADFHQILQHYYPNTTVTAGEP